MPTKTFFNLSDDKQRLILDAALEEFAKHDYTNASVSRIVAQAGIAKGSIYQYFQDKQDLYLYVLEHGMQKRFAFLRQRMGFFPYLRWLMEVNFEFELEQPQLSRFLRQATYGEVPFEAEALDQSRATSLKYIWQLVRQGCAQGELDVNTRLGAFIIHSLLGNLGDYVCERMNIDPMTMTAEEVAQVDRMPAHKIFDELARVLASGMAPPVVANPSTGQTITFPTTALNQTDTNFDEDLEMSEPEMNFSASDIANMENDLDFGIPE
jgi:AcrR family transcriptional regulator